MGGKVCRSGWALVLVTVASGATAKAGREVVEQVAAEINGDRIMLSEVLGELREHLASLPADLAPEARQRLKDALVRARLLHMIRRRLLLQEAERELDEAQQRAVTARVEEQVTAVARDAGSQEALRKRLEAEGRTLDDLRADLRRGMVISTYLAVKIRPGVHVTRRQMVDYYRRHRADFERPERRTWRIIMIRPDKFPQPADARTRAHGLRERLAQGADFAALAKEFSHGLRPEKGGLWGPMGHGEFAIPEIVRAVFSLPAGEVGPVIETADAFYLVKVEAIEPARKVSFADVQDEIRTRLTDEELSRRREELSLRLEQRAFVRVYYK